VTPATAPGLDLQGKQGRTADTPPQLRMLSVNRVPASAVVAFAVRRLALPVGASTAGRIATAQTP
jgi:hypothetical protein